MWKKMLLVLLGMVILGAVALGYLAVRMFKPELVRRDLRQEFTTTGLSIGRSTMSDVIDRFGKAERFRQEASGLLIEYPSKGLLFRVGGQPSTLYWYEWTTTAMATAKGVRVGDKLASVKTAYGEPDDIANLKGGLRVRYAYGTAYTLEFWITPATDRVTRVVFFKS
jgi:hypothetical protein